MKGAAYVGRKLTINCKRLRQASAPDSPIVGPACGLSATRVSRRLSSCGLPRKLADATGYPLPLTSCGRTRLVHLLIWKLMGAAELPFPLRCHMMQLGSLPGLQGYL
jgi:hypothetical protein